MDIKENVSKLIKVPNKEILVIARCIKHPYKKSKYYSQDRNIIDGKVVNDGFCKDCAVKLVRLGKTCDEIKNKEENEGFSEYISNVFNGCD